MNARIALYVLIPKIRFVLLPLVVGISVSVEKATSCIKKVYSVVEARHCSAVRGVRQRPFWKRP